MSEPVAISPEMFAAAEVMSAKLREHICQGTVPRFSDSELCAAIDAWHFRYGQPEPGTVVAASSPHEHPHPLPCVPAIEPRPRERRPRLVPSLRPCVSADRSQRPQAAALAHSIPIAASFCFDAWCRLLAMIAIAASLPLATD